MHLSLVIPTEQSHFTGSDRIGVAHQALYDVFQHAGRKMDTDTKSPLEQSLFQPCFST